MPDIKSDHHIDESELQLLFIASYYDGPIEGLAKYRGQIVRFVVEPETLFTGKELYRIEKLSEEELQYELEEKALFEREVGTHWSFDEVSGEPLPRWLADEQSCKAYFNKQKQQQEKIFPPVLTLGWSTSVR